MSETVIAFDAHIQGIYILPKRNLHVTQSLNEALQFELFFIAIFSRGIMKLPNFLRCLFQF